MIKRKFYLLSPLLLCIAILGCPDSTLPNSDYSLDAPLVSAETPVHGTHATWIWPKMAGAAGYRVSMHPETDSWTELDTEALSHTVAGLTAGTYTLFVQARDQHNQWSKSGFSTVLVEPLGDTRLRLMAANLTSGNSQSYDQGHGIRIIKGANPDVIMVQEFNYLSNSEVDLQSIADQVLGVGAYYFRESNVQIPNGIISRYPIIASGVWDDAATSNREFAWARIDIPGSVDLYAISIHFLTTNSTVRNSEAQSLIAFTTTHVPSGSYLVIAGTFNTNSVTEECYTALSPTFITSEPYPASPDGIQGTNSARTKPYDGLYANNNLTMLATPVIIGNASYPAGLVIDTRTYPIIADLAPALASDSGALNMQHMGVIRDFLIPGD